jgi:hypothetical protein
MAYTEPGPNGTGYPPAQRPAAASRHRSLLLAVGAVVLVLLTIGITVTVTGAWRPSSIAGRGSLAGPGSGQPTAVVPTVEPTQPTAATAEPTTTEPTTAEPATTAAPPRPVDPAGAMQLTDVQATAELGLLVDEDRTRVDALTGTWVAQLSSKCVGTRVDIEPDWVPDGTPETPHVTARQVLAFHLSLRDRFGAIAARPTALGIATDAPSSGACAGRRVWMSILPESYPTAADANAWCDVNVRPVHECQARYVAFPGERSATVPRG